MARFAATTSDEPGGVRVALAGDCDLAVRDEMTATLLASAVGGWAAGYLADRIGRVRTLQFTILWFSFFSMLCALVGRLSWDLAF